MKKLFFILIFIINLHFAAYSDDIKDFEIEGFSIGQSLLNYFSSNEIENNRVNYTDGKKKFYVVGFNKISKTYDFIEFYLKTSDKKFTVHAINAGIFYDSDFKQCENKKKKIVNEIRNIFDEQNMTDYGEFSHTYDKTGDSKQTAVIFEVDNGHSRVECINWSKKITKEYNWVDNLGISALSNEVILWIENGYQ